MKASIVDLLQRCSNTKELESLYSVMVKSCTNQDCFLVNQFIAACSKHNHLNYAILAYTHMENPNVFVYNAMIRGLVQCFQPIQALELYVHMLRAKVMPTSYTYSALIKACTLVSKVRFGESIHGHVWRNGFESHMFVQTALIDFYSSIGIIEGSEKVFREMPVRDSFSWTTMVSALARAGDLVSARRLFDMMPERRIATWNTLIDGYARIRDVESAELLFNQIPAKDIISWTTMINCYSHNKKFREAVEVFKDMTMNGITPDEVTMATVISACAHLGALSLGKEIHHYAVLNGFELDVYIGSALIDMYAKCGSLDRSLVVFFKLQEKNLFCWNSVIEGLATHGYAKEALTMFGKMEEEKVKPNEITFISILSACTHAGLIEEGRNRFKSMTCDYSITPKIEHYGCMVDLLSKAGLLEEALELIRTMNCKPNAVIWGSLLCGCKLHKDVDIAQIAINHLMVSQPDNSGYYAILVSMYAEANRWGEAAKVRETMKELGVEKGCPASSWIEGKTKFFTASDSTSI